MPDVHGSRYLAPGQEELANFVRDELPYLDFYQTIDWYRRTLHTLDDNGRAFLACNDRFFLLTGLLGRKDMLIPWLFDRCREVEADPDGFLDLWARYHYKSTIITTGGIIQEVVRNPEIKIAIFSFKQDIAQAFLKQIKRELEGNEYLKRVFADVLYDNPRRESPKWAENEGLVVKRRGNPKECTVEGHGLVDGQPTSRHFNLLVYDDVVTDRSVGTPEQVRKTTAAWELSDNLGSTGGVRKQHAGTRYSFGDSYGIILERGILKARIYPATDNGLLGGKPVLMTAARWEEVKKAQRSTIAAQMLLNPLAGNEAMFRAQMFRSYDVRPAILNVWILCDPSKGRTQRADRTAIAVMGMDPARNIYLLDGVRHRMKLSERFEHLKRFYRFWSVQQGVMSCTVGYEQYGMQSDIEAIELLMARDEEATFGIEEIGTPRQGGYSKEDRVERLEPDMRSGRFYLPAVVWHPDHGDPKNHYQALWKPADDGPKIIYRPMIGPTKLQQRMAVLQQRHRIVQPVKRLDENKDAYDLTRCFFEEAMFFPFAPKDDLVDAASRIYDMSPTPPAQYEDSELEAPAYID